MAQHTGNARKDLAKTLSWLVVSGLLFFVSALMGGSPLYTAFITTAIACALKTPVYMVHEMVFERLWHKASNRRTHSKADAIARLEKHAKHPREFKAACLDRAQWTQPQEN
jgi:uncharacterized membrane protein